MQGDVQEPDLRCGAFGTSGHVTAKSSICNRDVLYKSGVYASKITCLTLGDLSCALERRVRGELAEGRVIASDRMREVSRRHSRRRRSQLPGLETSPAVAGRTHPAEGLNGFRKELNDRETIRHSSKH